MMSRIAFISGLLTLAAMPGSAAAQCRLCEGQSPTASEDSAKPIELEIESGLKFDRMVLLGQGEGTVVVSPDGSQIVSGSLGDFSRSAMVGTAVVRGEPGRLIRIEFPKLIELYSVSGSKLLIDNIVTNLQSAPRLDSSGRLSFRFGGRLRVNGEADGEYRGDLPITADYL